MKCCTADNAAVNKKVKKILDIIHIGCSNHKLNLDIEDWMKHTESFKDTVNEIAKCMKAVKKSLKNMALLKNATKLNPVLYNATCWSGKFNMLDRFLRIRNDIIDISNNEESSGDIVINTSEAYERRVKQYRDNLQKFNQVTKLLQTHKYKLCECRMALDMLIEEATQQRHNHDSKLFGNTFTAKRILANGSL